MEPRRPSQVTFVHGPMGCGKSARVIARAHEERGGGRPVVVFTCDALTPDRVHSRAGDDLPARLLDPSALGPLVDAPFGAATLVLVDDVQLLSADAVRDLIRACDRSGVDAELHGLLLDFRSRLFASSAAALEGVDRAVGLDDEPRCWCGALATRNGRIVEGRMVTDGPAVLIGDLSSADDPLPHYASLCRLHWRERKHSAVGTGPPG